jgi:hypothetical protein
MAGVVILAGHYIDFFNMIMPGTVGDRWFIGCQKLLLFFSSWVIYICCFLQHWLNHLCYQKKSLHRRVNIFIINI